MDISLFESLLMPQCCTLGDVYLFIGYSKSLGSKHDVSNCFVKLLWFEQQAQRIGFNCNFNDLKLKHFYKMSCVGIDVTVALESVNLRSSIFI